MALNRYEYYNLQACTQCKLALYDDTTPEFVAARLTNKGTILFRCLEDTLDLGTLPLEISELNFNVNFAKNDDMCWRFEQK